MRQFELAPAPHTHVARDVTRIMRQVLLALLPSVLLASVLLGLGALLNLLLAIGFAVLVEAFCLRLRGRPIWPTLQDGSAVVSGALLAMALPPLLPWWITLCGVVVAIALGKHLYGGLGMNPFNPAMLGYVALIVSFPVFMTRWPDAAASPPGPWPVLHYTLTGTLPASMGLDAITGATPLDHLRNQLRLAWTWSEIRASAYYGPLGGARWQWLNLAWLAGGLWLMYRRIVRWQIPLALLAGLVLPSLMFSLVAPDRFPGPMLHLFSGATMLGAFFIATDPVSASTTPRGRLIYGFGIGLLLWLIRSFGSYPDAVAFSVLLMNLAVPLIDRYTLPTRFGAPRL